MLLHVCEKLYMPSTNDTTAVRYVFHWINRSHLYNNSAPQKKCDNVTFQKFKHHNRQRNIIKLYGSQKTKQTLFRKSAPQ